jgi:hypothetical protein
MESTRPSERPRNRWKYEVKEDGRIVGGEEWKEKVCNREEWKKFLRMARNCRILHMAMDWNRKDSKSYPITGHERLEGEYRCNFTLSLISAIY